MIIRPENTSDIDAVWQVVDAAFPTSAEAILVNALRERTEPYISLVAANASGVVGHVALSPVTIEGGNCGMKLMGLAPLAVVPEYQKQGIGAALMEAAIQACRTAQVDGVVLLGSPAYYPRFGFVPAAEYGLKCTYAAPVEAFMIKVLSDKNTQALKGIVHYHAAFAEL